MTHSVGDRGSVFGPFAVVEIHSLADARNGCGFDWLNSEAEFARAFPRGAAEVWLRTPRGGHTGIPGHAEVPLDVARLWAAAPALLEALRHYACSCEPGHCAMSADDSATPVDESLCGRRAQAAIQSATGEG